MNYGDLTGAEESPIDIDGAGSCRGDFGGPYTLQLDGTGLGDDLTNCAAAISQGGLGAGTIVSRLFNAVKCIATGADNQGTALFVFAFVR